MALRLVGGGAGWPSRQSGAFSGHDRRPKPAFQRPTLHGIALAIAGLLCDAADMIGAGAEPDVCSRIERSSVLSGMDPAKAGAVAPAIAGDLDAWANDRRRRNLRNIPADRARLEYIIRGCQWCTLEDSGPDTFVRFLSQMRRPLETDDERRRPWIGATCNREQTRLSGLLADAARRNPQRRLLNWALALPRADTDDSDDGSRPLSMAEFARLASWVGKHRPKVLPILVFLAYTGVRFDEAKRLEIGQEVFLEGTPRIVLTRRTKKKKKRTIPIQEDLLPFVRRAVGRRKAGRLFQTFTTIRTIRNYCRLAGVDDTDVGFHSFRKCFAGLCATSGVDLPAAAKMLGHDDPKLTQNLYTHFDDGELAEQVGRLRRMVGFPHARDRPRQTDLTKAHASADTGPAETEQAMEATLPTTRSPVPGRAGDHRTSQQRASRRQSRPGTDDRGPQTEPSRLRPRSVSAKSHLRDLNSRPMLYESTGPGDAPPAEALADLFEVLARFLRRGAQRAHRQYKAG